MEKAGIKQISYHFYGGFHGGSYSICIDEEGLATFKGEDRSRGLFGTYSCELYDTELGRLSEFVHSSGFMNMNDDYPAEVLDGWSERVKIVFKDGDIKEIGSNIGCGPVELWALMRSIEGLVIPRLGSVGNI